VVPTSGPSIVAGATWERKALCGVKSAKPTFEELAIDRAPAGIRKRYGVWCTAAPRNHPNALFGARVVPVPFRVSSQQIPLAFGNVVPFSFPDLGVRSLGRCIAPRCRRSPVACHCGRRLPGVLAPLRDEQFFGQVFIDCGSVAWPGEIDLAPDAMYAQAAGQHDGLQEWQKCGKATTGQLGTSQCPRIPPEASLRMPLSGITDAILLLASKG